MTRRLSTSSDRRGHSTACGFVPRLESLQAREVPANFTVGDGRGADFATIQAAVDAAALTKGPDLIRVLPGEYREQVTIVGSRLDGLTLLSVREERATIKAPATLADSGAYVAVVQISGAENVTLDGFTIAGPSAKLEVGVLIDNDASVTIRDNRITNIRPQAALGGDQIGIGLLIQGASHATIADNTIEKYQKGGIVAFDKGTFVAISDNTITGSGKTAAIAQNGIQVSYGASAAIFDNTVTRNSYAVPDTAANVTDAAGIVLGGPADPNPAVDVGAGSVIVYDNDLDRNEVGILVENQSEPVSLVGNDIHASDKDGIALYGVVGAYLIDNKVTGSRQDGLRVAKESTAPSSNNVQTKDNFIHDNVFVGSLAYDIFDTTVGSGTGGTANYYGHNRFNSSYPTVR